MQRRPSGSTNFKKAKALCQPFRMTPEEAQPNLGQLAIRTKHKKLRRCWDGSGYTPGRYSTYGMGKLAEHTEVLILFFEVIPICLRSTKH